MTSRLSVRNKSTYGSEERFGNKSRSCVELGIVSNEVLLRSGPEFVGSTYEELHLRNLLINLLHKLNDEVDQLVLQHLLGMEVRNEERNIVSLNKTISILNLEKGLVCHVASNCRRDRPATEASGIP